MNDLFDMLDKSKCYCNKCFKQGIITELSFNKQNGIYNRPNCGHLGSGFYRLEFINNKWSLVLGLKENSKPQTEIIQKVLEVKKSSGYCSICGRFNKIRDNFCRGNDQKIWINKEGIECGCNCHNEWFLNHNSTPKMIEQSRRMGIKWQNSEAGKKFLLSHNKSHKMRNQAKILGMNPNKFDRNKFYKEKLNIITFDSLDEDISIEDFYKLRGKLGVWSRWTEDGICLDVCKTKDIGKEMLSSLRSFYSLKKNPNQKLDISWKRKYKKQLDDCKDGKMIFKLVAICENEKEALDIEKQYAHDNKAKYWHP